MPKGAINKGKSSAELEFIVESDNELYPIDVKKSRGVLNSLEKFSDHNKFRFAIKISRNNYGFSPEQKMLTVPFYFVSFMAEELSDGCFRLRIPTGPPVFD